MIIWFFLNRWVIFRNPNDSIFDTLGGTATKTDLFKIIERYRKKKINVKVSVNNVYSMTRNFWGNEARSFQKLFRSGVTDLSARVLKNDHSVFWKTFRRLQRSSWTKTIVNDLCSDWKDTLILCVSLVPQLN